MRKTYCSCCGKQLVTEKVPRTDPHRAPAAGAKADVKGAFCGYCAEELDENGLFPEEAAMQPATKGPT